jgi:hypothetical protein
MKMFDQLRNDPLLSREFRIGNLSFRCKDIVPLQAADVLAYEIFKQVENQVLDRGEKHAIRLSVKDLMRPQDAVYLKYWDKPRLREWLTNSQSRGALNNMRKIWDV